MADRRGKPLKKVVGMKFPTFVENRRNNLSVDGKSLSKGYPQGETMPQAGQESHGAQAGGSAGADRSAR